MDRVSICPCGKRFVQRRNNNTGKSAPITEYTVEGGNIEILADGSYRIVPYLERTADPRPRHVNHFVDCPLAASFARKGGDR